MGSLAEEQIYEGAAAEARLNQLGLRIRDLIQSVRASELERRSCSSLEPSNAPGFKAWAAAFRTLAESLVERGWEKVESHGLPRLVNVDTGMAVAVLTGDAGVGLRDGTPMSVSPRGVQSILLVRSNKRQLQLFPGDPRFRRTPPAEEQMTWWLMIYSNEHGTLRAELALPVGLDDENRLSIWEERIILEIPRTDDLQRVIPDHDESPLEIKVNVRPRV